MRHIGLDVGIERRRLLVVLVTIGLSVGMAYYFSHRPEWGGRSAVLLNACVWGILIGYAVRFRDAALGYLMGAAGWFGGMELFADFLCVRCTRTLDYGVSGSWMLLESPWWMPWSWGLLAVQFGVLGAAAIGRYGRTRGMLLVGASAAVVIPFYEEMAWSAQWWRYLDCLMVGRTPIYIILTEAMIGGALALMGHGVLRNTSLRQSLRMGVATGMFTILAGAIGWGLIEFLGQGKRPYGLF